MYSTQQQCTYLVACIQSKINVVHVTCMPTEHISPALVLCSKNLGINFKHVVWPSILQSLSLPSVITTKPNFYIHAHLSYVHVHVHVCNCAQVSGRDTWRLWLTGGVLPSLPGTTQATTGRLGHIRPSFHVCKNTFPSQPLALLYCYYKL